MNNEKVKPFDSFSTVYKILVWTGYFKLLIKPKNRIKWISHQMYRTFAISMALIFNLQHITFTIQRRDSKDEVFDSLMIEIPQLNLLAKILTINLQISRMDRINKLINDPIFSGLSAHDEELLLNNQRNMHRLYKIVNISVTISGILWPASHFVRRYQDASAVVPSYVPFETDTWSKYTLSVLFEVVPLLWIGYGHLAFDCLMSAYYAQAGVQLKIIKYNLEHLFDVEGAGCDGLARNKRFNYIDEIDQDFKKRFVYYVQRFEKLAWYANEIDAVFGPAMSFQFFTTSVIMCMVVYLMSFTPAASVPFMFMVILLVIISTQGLLYCYYGNLVRYESHSIVNSVYLSDWLSVSPKFRRLLLIAMLRWSRTLAPRIAGIIPLSLNTFVSIIRTAYSMYAVLGTRKS